MEEKHAVIRWGVEEEFIHLVRASSVGCVAQIGPREFLGVTQKEIAKFETAEIQEYLPYQCTAIQYIPTFELSVGVTSVIAEFMIFLDTDIRTPILTGVKTGDPSIFNIVFFPKSSVIITAGEDIKTWSISIVHSSQNKMFDEPSVCIAPLATVYPHYRSSIMNPPAYDINKEHIFLITPQGDLNSYTVRGTHLNTHLHLDDKTTLCYNPNNHRFFTANTEQETFLWHKAGRILRRYIVNNNATLAIRFINNEYVVILDANNTITILDIKTGRSVACYHTDYRVCRFFYFDSETPRIILCCASRIIILKVILPWRLWHSTITKPIKIARMPKFNEAARIFVTCSDYHIKLISPAKKCILTALTLQALSYPLDAYYDRGDKENKRDQIFLPLENGTMQIYSTGQNPCEKVSTLDLRSTCMCLCIYKGEPCFCFGSALGNLFMYTVKVLHQIGRFVLLPNPIFAVFYCETADCFVVTYVDRVYRVDMTGKLREQIRMKGSRTFISFDDTYVFAHENGEVGVVCIRDGILVPHETNDMKLHEAAITGLSVGSVYFVSSSLDCSIRVWTKDFNLICTLIFPLPLFSCGVMNGKRDILAGTETEIMIIKGETVFHGEIDPYDEDYDNYDSLNDFLEDQTSLEEEPEEEEEPESFFASRSKLPEAPKIKRKESNRSGRFRAALLRKMYEKQKREEAEKRKKQQQNQNDEVDDATKQQMLNEMAQITRQDKGIEVSEAEKMMREIYGDDSKRNEDDDDEFVDDEEESEDDAVDKILAQYGYEIPNKKEIELAKANASFKASLSSKSNKQSKDSESTQDQDQDQDSSSVSKTKGKGGKGKKNTKGKKSKKPGQNGDNDNDDDKESGMGEDGSSANKNKKSKKKGGRIKPTDSDLSSVSIDSKNSKSKSKNMNNQKGSKNDGNDQNNKDGDGGRGNTNRKGGMNDRDYYSDYSDSFYDYSDGGDNNTSSAYSNMKKGFITDENGNKIEVYLDENGQPIRDSNGNYVSTSRSPNNKNNEGGESSGHHRHHHNGDGNSSDAENDGNGGRSHHRRRHGDGNGSSEQNEDGNGGRRHKRHRNRNNDSDYSDNDDPNSNDPSGRRRRHHHHHRNGDGDYSDDGDVNGERSHRRHHHHNHQKREDPYAIFDDFLEGYEGEPNQRRRRHRGNNDSSEQNGEGRHRRHHHHSNDRGEYSDEEGENGEKRRRHGHGHRHRHGNNETQTGEFNDTDGGAEGENGNENGAGAGNGKRRNRRGGNRNDYSYSDYSDYYYSDDENYNRGGNRGKGGNGRGNHKSKRTGEDGVSDSNGDDSILDSFKDDILNGNFAGGSKPKISMKGRKGSNGAGGAGFNSSSAARSPRLLTTTPTGSSKKLNNQGLDISGKTSEYKYQKIVNAKLNRPPRLLITRRVPTPIKKEPVKSLFERSLKPRRSKTPNPNEIKLPAFAPVNIMFDEELIERLIKKGSPFAKKLIEMREKNRPTLQMNVTIPIKIDKPAPIPKPPPLINQYQYQINKVFPSILLKAESLKPARSPRTMSSPYASHIVSPRNQNRYQQRNYRIVQSPFYGNGCPIRTTLLLPSIKK